VLLLLPIIKELASFINMVNVDVATLRYERKLRVNTFGCCILYNPGAMLQLMTSIKVLATFIGNIVNVVVATPKNERQQSVNRALTEDQLFWVLNHV